MFNHVVVLLALLASTPGCLSKQVCYKDGVGCFSDSAPWDNMPLPMSPDKIPPTYLLLQKGKSVREIRTTNELKLDNFVILIHGILDGYNATIGWNSKIISNLHQIRPDADVLFFDWEKGAALGTGLNVYHQPASNVRVLAQMLALWLKAGRNFDSSKAHCIGFSLGAHLCGLTAKRLNTKWGRLTALDPAGPGYMKEDSIARVDKSDGVVVDVMHVSWVSLKRQLGHKDFYVNDAKIQPGCHVYRKKRDVLDDIQDFFSCSHRRAAYLFAYTIVPDENCQLLFCPCSSMEKFKKGYCRNCDPKTSALLGYRSIETENEGEFYGDTTSQEPFCKNN